MKRDIAIYVLCGLPSCEVFYVGKSKNPRARLNSHLAWDTYGAPEKQLRMHGILKDGGRIGLKIIEWVPQSVVRDAERYWIGFFVHSGAKLENDPRDIDFASVDYFSGRYAPSVLLPAIDEKPDFISGTRCGMAQGGVPEEIKSRQRFAEMHRPSEDPAEAAAQRKALDRVKYDITQLDGAELREVLACVKGRIESLRSR